MSEVRIKTRPVGATATLGRMGAPSVTSATGGTLPVVTGASEPGFNPLDLLYASLSACLVLSARIATSRLGVLDRLTSVTAEVTGDKAHDGPSRVEKFHIRFDIQGDLDLATRQAIATAAEGEICTVSNTLQGAPAFSMTLAD